MTRHLPSKDYKTSAVVAQQLPDFIRDEYPLFVELLEKFYAWTEEDGNVNDETNTILDNRDVDKTREDLLKYFAGEFLKLVPEKPSLTKDS